MAVLAAIAALGCGGGADSDIGEPIVVRDRNSAPLETYIETAGGLNFKMIAVEGGTFTMGCTAEQGSDCWPEERPTLQVTLNDFYIGEFEVTQKLWKQVMKSTVQDFAALVGHDGLFGVGDDYPMYYMTWRAAQNFTVALNAITGKRYRLPTEAEWEYAARGGKKSKGYKYSGGDVIEEVGWYYQNSLISIPSEMDIYNGLEYMHGSSNPVGGKQPNELGIYDMSGNVYEWVDGWFRYYKNIKNGKFKKPLLVGRGLVDTRRLFRGGGWSDGARWARVSGLRGLIDGGRRHSIGFRLAISAESVSGNNAVGNKAIPPETEILNR